MTPLRFYFDTPSHNALHKIQFPRMHCALQGTLLSNHHRMCNNSVRHLKLNVSVFQSTPIGVISTRRAWDSTLHCKMSLCGDNKGKSVFIRNVGVYCSRSYMFPIIQGQDFLQNLRKAYGIWYIAIVLKLPILILVHNMIGCGADLQWTTMKMIHNYNCLASFHPQENLYIW